MLELSWPGIWVWGSCPGDNLDWMSYPDVSSRFIQCRLQYYHKAEMTWTNTSSRIMWAYIDVDFNLDSWSQLQPRPAQTITDLHSKHMPKIQQDNPDPFLTSKAVRYQLDNISAGGAQQKLWIPGRSKAVWRLRNGAQHLRRVVSKLTLLFTFYAQYLWLFVYNIHTYNIYIYMYIYIVLDI